MLTDEDRKIIEVDGQKMSYFDYGEGMPLVMIHGFPDTPYSFISQIKFFNEHGYRVITPYLPGYLHSDSPKFGSFFGLTIAKILDQFIAQLVPTFNSFDPKASSHPASQDCLLSTGGHFIHYDNADEFNQKVLDFINQFESPNLVENVSRTS